MTLLYYFLTFSAIYILLGWSIYLPYRAGHLYFLSIPIMAISAYFAGVAAREWNFPLLFIIIAGVLIGFLISFLMSLIIGDAPGFSVVMVGLTLMFVVKTVVENWDWLGGSIGFFHIPSTQNLLIWTYIFLIIAGYFVFLIENSQIIQQASAIFYHKHFAESIGVSYKRIGIFLHSFAGMLAGLSGVLYALLVGGLTVDFFGFGMSGTLMAILFLGGRDNMWGMIVSAIFLGGIPILLPSELIAWKQVIYGSLLILIVLFYPEGVLTRRKIKNLRSKIIKNRSFSPLD